MTDYAPGTPSWVDLSAPDPDASAAFYGELMGWGTTEPAEQAGGYRMFEQDGQMVGGLTGQMQEAQPSAWTTYIAVTDADATAEKVRDAGGQVLFGPMDMTDTGRAAFFADPTGAVFGVWQAKAFGGADLVNVPNSVCWNEVLTRDAEADKAFYTAVFGWAAGRPQFEGAPETYTVWELDGKPVGGMMEINEYFPPDLPPHWSVCFAVADCDATVAKARKLGATVRAEPMDMTIGRFAGLVDPQGASFAVMQMAG